MKAFTLAIVAGLSIAVSMMLWMSMPNVDEPDPTVPSEPDTELIKSTVQLSAKPKPKPQEVQPEKLYTFDHVIAYPERYNYDEAWDVFRVRYNDERQSCYNEYADDIITLNECVTIWTSWWLEVETALERAYP